MTSARSRLPDLGPSLDYIEDCGDRRLSPELAPRARSRGSHAFGIPQRCSRVGYLRLLLELERQGDVLKAWSVEVVIAYIEVMPERWVNTKPYGSC